MRPATVLKLAGIAASLLVIVLVQVVKSINVDRYRAVLIQTIEAETGRSVSFGGRVVLRLSLTPFLEANDVSIANMPGGDPQPMLRIDRLEADIGLLALMMGEVQIARLRLAGVDLLLERKVDGTANWQFGRFDDAVIPPDKIPPTVFRISQLQLRDGRMRYLDHRSGEVDLFHIERLTADTDSLSTPVAVAAAGSWARGVEAGRRIDLSGVVGSVQEAFAGGKPFPVKLRAVLPGLVATVLGTVRVVEPPGASIALAVTAEMTELADASPWVGSPLPPLGAARLAMRINGPLAAPALDGIDFALGRHDGLALSVKGSWKSPLTGTGVDLVVAADGETLAGWVKPFDLSLPAVGPVKATAHITDLPGGWRFGDFKATIGHSDATGQASLQMSSGRPGFEAHLLSTSLTLDDFFAPHGEPQKPHLSDGGRVFSDTSLPLHWLSLMDVELSWKADRIVYGTLTFGPTDLQGSLHDGRLRLLPRIDGIAGGRASGALAIDRSGSVASVTLTADAEKLLLGQLLTGLSIAADVKGAPMDLHAELTGSGGSLRALMSKLSGEAALSVGAATVEDGPADRPLVMLLGQFSPEAAAGETEIHCVASRFSVADGMAHSEGFFLDPPTMTMAGQGSVNLADEELDFTFSPKPKDAGLNSQAVPVDIAGTIGYPLVTLSKGAIVKGIASPASSGGVGPSAAKDDNACLAALAQTKRTLPIRKALGKVGGGR